MRSSLVSILLSGTLAETKALYAAMTVKPSSQRVHLHDQFIRALKSCGAWDGIDVAWLTAGHDAQATKLNLKNPATFTLTNGGTAPTFAVDRGYTGNGASGRLQTGYTPSSNGVKYVQDSASGWVWCTDNAQGSAAFGYVGSPRCQITPRDGSDRIAYSINDATAATAAGITDSSGLTGIQRTGAGARAVWKNGVSVKTDAQASTGAAAGELWIGGANSSSFSTHQVAFAAAGASLAGLEPALYAAVRTYLQAVGAAP